MPAAKEFTLAERDKHMSEQKQSFMQQLDEWTESTVINPLLSNDGESDEFVGGETIEQIQKAIRAKSWRATATAGRPAAPPVVAVRR